MAGINVKNIALILGVSVFDIGTGLYDRLVNGIGVLNSLAALTGAIPFKADTIHPFSGAWATAGIIGVVLVVFVVAYLVFMLVGLGGVGSMGGRR